MSSKICIIGTTADSITGFRSDLIKQLIVYGYEVFAFTCEYNEAQLSEISALGAKPITYEMSRGGLNPFADLKTIIELKEKLLILSQM